MSLPDIRMVGTIVADPELRFTPSGKAVTNFRVATNRSAKENGEWVQKDSCFLTCTIWEQKAEAVAELVQRGDKVIVHGTLRQREYETREGEKRTVYEVSAQEVALVVKGQVAERSNGQRNDPWANAGQTQNDPWGEPPF